MSSARQQTDAQKRIKVDELLRRDLRRHAVSLFGISGLINLLALTGSIYMMQVYDRALTSGSVITLVSLSVLALGMYAFQGAFDTIRAQIMVRIGARLDQRLAPIAHRITIDLPRYGYSTTEALERGRAIDTLRAFLSGSAPAALFDLPWMPIFLTFVYLLHPVLFGLTITGALVLAIITVLAEIKSRNVTQAAHQAMVARNIAAESNARNSDAIIAMGLVDRAVTRFEKVNAAHLMIQKQSADVNATLTALSRVLRMILQSALLGTGAYLAINGELSAGSIMAVSIASGRALAPIDQVISNWRVILAARHAHSQLRDALMAMKAPHASIKAPVPKATLDVEGLTIASPATGRILLADVSFQLKAGQALAVIGPSGGGKSTLLRALSSVWPVVRGSIRVDGTDIRHWDPARMGEVIGYLPQEVNLFNGSVIDNICRLSETPDGDEIFAAAQLAGVHGMISSFPDGYETQVGSQGSALSAGQCQRIGLARAMYGKPFVVLLDEPNSALDAFGEKALNEAIRSMRERGAIVIVVAHRAVVLEAVDMVAFIQGGKLAAFGTKEEVMAKRSDRVVVPMDAQQEPSHSLASGA